MEENRPVEDLAVLKYMIPGDEAESKVIGAMLDDIISPVNHITRMSKINANLQLAVEEIKQNPGLEIDVEKNLLTTSKAVATAKELLKLHSNKELRREARALIKTAREFTMILNLLKSQQDAKSQELAVVARDQVAS